MLVYSNIISAHSARSYLVHQISQAVFGTKHNFMKVTGERGLEFFFFYKSTSSFPGEPEGEAAHFTTMKHDETIIFYLVTVHFAKLSKFGSH